MSRFQTVRFAAILAPALMGCLADVAAAEPTTTAPGQAGCPASAQSSHDAATGQASGKRQHQPISVTKPSDAAQSASACGDSSAPADQTLGAPLKGVDVKLGK